MEKYCKHKTSNSSPHKVQDCVKFVAVGDLCWYWDKWVSGNTESSWLWKRLKHISQCLPCLSSSDPLGVGSALRRSTDVLLSSPSVETTTEREMKQLRRSHFTGHRNCELRGRDNQVWQESKREWVSCYSGAMMMNKTRSPLIPSSRLPRNRQNATLQGCSFICPFF